MMKRAAAAMAGGCLAVLMSGCGLVYQSVGHTLNRYTLDEAVPYALASNDLNQSACGTGLGLTQLIGSFSRVIDRPARVLLSTNTLAAFCSESQAQDAHLLTLRSLYYDNPGIARDNREIAKRWERVTALRRYQVYRDTTRAYGEFGGESCPDLDHRDAELDELQFMVGVLTSVQGILSDIQADSSVGIPQNIAPAGARALQCLDNDKWWGVPKAVEAVVWLSVPGSSPDGIDPWTQLQQSVAIGQRDGIALSAMLYAIAAYNQSDVAREKDAIRSVATIYDESEEAGRYRILNELAYSYARYLSDRLWMQAEGNRTPLQMLGRFPGERSSGDDDFDAASFLN